MFFHYTIKTNLVKKDWFFFVYYFTLYPTIPIFIVMKTEEKITTEKTITDAIDAILNIEWNEKVSTCGLTYGEINELEKYNN